MPELSCEAIQAAPHSSKQPAAAAAAALAPHSSGNKSSWYLNSSSTKSRPAGIKSRPPGMPRARRAQLAASLSRDEAELILELLGDDDAALKTIGR